MADDQGLAIGIDLGTTYSCVAVSRNNNVEIIVNEQGKRTTPSCVAFTSTELLIGDSAKNIAARSPSNTIFDAKRLIGRRYSETTVQEDMAVWPFKVVPDAKQEKPMIVVEYKGEEKKFLPEEISSRVLSKMKEYAENFLGCKVKNAVITVPAYFNDSQRRSTKLAGEIAGLNVMRVLNEPTAAAIAYGLTLKDCGDREKKKVLVFDLGGGTFDVSVLEIENVTIEVKATAGDTHLGGEDFDNRLVNHCVEMFRKQHIKDISGNKRSMSRLKSECEKAKTFLSSSTQTDIVVDALYDGIDFDATLTRAKFENLNIDLFEKCIQIVKTCLADAKIEKRSIDEVVLVGGSTKIPMVRKLLEDFFDGKKLNCTINADEAVAYGAAVHAAESGGNVQQKRNDILLLDITPLSLGVALERGFMSVVVPKNTRIPARKEEEYTTVMNDQTGIDFHIYEGERSMVKDNNPLGKITIDGITPAPVGVPRVIVSFFVNRDGILEVTAMNKDTRRKVKVVITNSIGNYTQDEIDKMIRDAKRYEFEDNLFKKRVEAKNALESYANNVKNAVDKSNLGTWEKMELRYASTIAIAWSEEHEDDMEAEANEFDHRRFELEKLCQSYGSKLNI